MRGHHSSRIATLCSGVLLAVLLSGCQYVYNFQVRGKVRSALDGSELADVRIELREMGLRREFGRDQGNPRENEAGRQLPIPHHGTGYWV